MLNNILKRKKIKEVFLLEKEFLIKIDIVEKKDIIFIKKTRIVKNNFKIKERLKEHFDVFFQNKKKDKIFPIIKLSQQNVEENRLNFAIKNGENLENIICCVVKYNRINVKNKIGVVFYLENEQIKKEDVKFKLQIGNCKYLELKNEKGLILI